MGRTAVKRAQKKLILFPELKLTLCDPENGENRLEERRQRSNGDGFKERVEQENASEASRE